MGFFSSGRFVGCCFLLLLYSRCPVVLGQQPNFNKSCFGFLQKHDVDQNGSLNPNEYTTFVMDLTRGIARQPLPPDLIQVFMSMADPESQQIPVQGAAEGADAQSAAYAAKLCSNVNYVLRALLQVTIQPDQCMSYLVASDTTIPKGEISKEPEYIALLSGLTGTPYTQTSFDQLSILTRNAYTDMAINGVIAGSAGTQYLTEFCSRALTAAKLDEIADKTNPPDPAAEVVTETDAAAAVDENNAAAAVDENNAAAAVDENNAAAAADENNAAASASPPGANTTAEPTGTDETTQEAVQEDVEMPDLFYERCKSSMLLIDRNRDNKLNRNEFGLLIDRLAGEVNNTASSEEADYFYDNRFEQVMRGEADSDPSIRGSKPAQIPSNEDIASLKFVCQTTFQAMVDSSTAASADEEVAKGMMKQTGRTAPLDAAFFTDCRRSMYIADSDRNIGLDVDEFIEFVERLAPDAEYVESFGDLEDELQEVYKTNTIFLRDANQFMIDVSGSKPASRATDEEMERMEVLCGAMQSVLVPLEDEDASSD